MVKTLPQIGAEQMTDKSCLHHHYLDLYELLFKSIRNYNINILEVGVLSGCSIKTWREYFPNAEIIGIDSMDNGAKNTLTGLARVEIGDAYTDEMLSRFNGIRFDIIIDDGSHAPRDQSWFVHKYSSLLTDNGILIVEDVSVPALIPELVKALPEGFNHVSVDMTEGGKLWPSRLFICWKTQKQFEPVLAEDRPKTEPPDALLL